MNNRTLMAALITAFALLTAALHAQVPQIINYQGRVAVGATNFDGPGAFKFALVNAAGTTTFWSNDGTSTAGSQPTAAVTLTVTKGLYSVLLGDTALAGMTAIPNSVFANADVRLRVWFNDGTNGSQLLSPDQRIAAVGYAMIAGGVPNGAITSPMIANGAVTSTQLAPGAAAANLSATGQSGVASGGLVFSATENPAMVSAGYQRVGAITTPEAWAERHAGTLPPGNTDYTTAVWTGSEMIIWGNGVSARFHPGNNTWTMLPTSGAPSLRIEHTAIWTGTEMIIWGGRSGATQYNNGARYHPVTNTWTPVTTTGAPAPRTGHVALWTGSEMLIWGGYTMNTGARYNPATDSWTPMSTVSAPAGRGAAKAVWTGTQMIIWGGEIVNTGGIYDPGSDTWTATNTVDAPEARVEHTAVWTGSEMIVWGGWNFGTRYNSGGRYNPISNTWTPTSLAYSLPFARRGHTAVWTGSEMIVWGGETAASTYTNTGARYAPATNTWTTTTIIAAPPARSSHTAGWSGSEMIIWGGIGFGSSNTFTYTPSRTFILYQRP